MIYFLIPKRQITWFIGWASALNARWFTKIVIDIFVYLYKVDMSEAKLSNTGSYKNFSEFFSRALKDNTRTIDPRENMIILPVDGNISQIGRIRGEHLLQAKSYSYTLYTLLAGQQDIVEEFYNGDFINIYLGPGDYHRVHMPCKGALRKMIYVPGELHSVDPTIVDVTSNIFSRNERVICYFETSFGPFVQILVGASIVGSIETVWEGTITPPRHGVMKCWQYTKQDREDILKGQEMGRFKLGSTVIGLFPSGSVALCNYLKQGSKIRVGQPMARVLKES
jgi:phosphatidylserine decarboxylase